MGIEKLKTVVVLKGPFDRDGPLPDDLADIETEFRNDDSAGATHKNVYACFGMAAYWAQCVEVELLLVLLAGAKLKGEAISVDDMEALEGKHAKSTLGRLISSLKEVIEFNDNFVGLLQAALDTRNHLSHHFFYENAEAMLHTSGQKRLFRKLLKYVELFMLANDTCVATRQLFLRHMSISQDNIDREYMAMLKEDELESKA